MAFHSSLRNHTDRPRRQAWRHRPTVVTVVALLLIWQVCIVDGSEENLQTWHRMLRKARLAAPITDAQIRLALGFMREMEPDPQELNAFQLRYNQLFLPEEGVFYLH